MAINSAFEPDNADGTPSSAAHTPKNASNDAVNERTPNEGTSFNLNLDTYFSDEKIRIPDKVRCTAEKRNSDRHNNNTICVNILISRRVLVSENYGLLQDLGLYFVPLKLAIYSHI